MKRLLFLSIAALFNAIAFGQLLKVDPTRNCSEVLNVLSYYWKLDSSGSNGFRLSNVDVLLKCKIDKVYRSVLCEKPGKPNNLIKTDRGSIYEYYYLDKNAMPKEFDMPLACFYIRFIFDKYDTYVEFIADGSYDL